MDRPPIDALLDEQAGEVDWDALATLRDQCPIAKLPNGFFAFTRYADVSEALRNAGKPAHFSHKDGMLAPGVVVPDDEQLMSEIDGPRHQRLRRLIVSVLHPRIVHDAEPTIRAIASVLIQELIFSKGGDLVAEFAVPIPSQVLAHLVGLPKTDFTQFKIWSDEVVTRSVRAPGPDGSLRFEYAHPEFSAYIDGLITDRRKAPGNDLISRMVVGDEQGDHLSDTEIRVLLMHLIVAGNETTAHLIANLLFRLISNRDLYNRVRQDRRLVPFAVEESLRIDPPVLGRPITAKCDITKDGIKIPGGSRVFMSIASANRDEEEFLHADVFDIDRPQPIQHVAFGGGAHFCPGAQLARVEARFALDVFLDLVDAPVLADGLRRMKVPAVWANGPRSLRVTL